MPGLFFLWPGSGCKHLAQVVSRNPYPGEKNDRQTVMNGEVSTAEDGRFRPAALANTRWMSLNSP